MVTCTSCGVDLSEDTVFCKEYGTKIDKGKGYGHAVQDFTEATRLSPRNPDYKKAL